MAYGAREGERPGVALKDHVGERDRRTDMLGERVGETGERVGEGVREVEGYGTQAVRTTEPGAPARIHVPCGELKYGA